jgi:hypothetical protein
MSAFDPKRTPADLALGLFQSCLMPLRWNDWSENENWPVEAYGQKPRIPRIGYLFSFTEREGQQLWDACREGLQELGYIAGQNITLEPRWAEGRHDRLPALANELQVLPAACERCG